MESHRESTLVRVDMSKDNDESLRSSNLKRHVLVRVGVDGFSTVIWNTYTSMKEYS